MDLSKLTNGDRIVGVSGILLFLFSFLPWFGSGSGPSSRSLNAWDLAFWGVIPVEIGVALVVIIGLQRFANATVLDLGSLRWGDAFLAASGVACAIVVLKLLTGEDGEFGIGDLDREYGLILAALAVIGLAVGGFLRMREDRAGEPGGATPPRPPSE